MFRYKSEREKQFRDHEARYAGSKGDIAAQIDMDTKNRIAGMNTSVGANKNKVIGDLINAVSNIDPRVHVNYRAG